MRTGLDGQSAAKARWVLAAATNAVPAARTERRVKGRKKFIVAMDAEKLREIY